MSHATAADKKTGIAIKKQPLNILIAGFGCVRPKLSLRRVWKSRSAGLRPESYREWLDCRPLLATCIHVSPQWSQLIDLTGPLSGLRMLQHRNSEIGSGISKVVLPRTRLPGSVRTMFLLPSVPQGLVSRCCSSGLIDPGYMLGHGMMDSATGWDKFQQLTMFRSCLMP